MSQQLRDYQQSALDHVRDEFRAGRRSVCLVAPTGSGKTTIASHIILSAVAKGRSVVFCAHRKELVDQASARLDEHGVPHGVLMADHPRYRPALQVQVVSIQTILRRATRPPADLLVLDECAHAAAKSWTRLRAIYPDAWVVGLTATPWRLDGRGLAEHFQASVLAAKPRELIAAGHLCDYAGYRYQSPDVSRVAVRGGDFESHGLELACSGSSVVGNVVGEWMAHARGCDGLGLRTVLFAVNLRHAYLLADTFRAQGVEAETVDYTMIREQREAILARARSGRTRVLANVNLLTEGWDLPSLECAVLARPTKSLALFLQMCGRVMRPSPATGKTVARIHDHGGLVERFGLPDADRDYSLTNDRKSQEARPPPLTTCLGCFAIFSRSENGNACPECGAVLPAAKPRGDVEESAGVAVDIRTVADQRRDRATWLAGAVETCLQLGYKPGWLVHQHAKRFPNAPKPWGAYREVARRQAEQNGDAGDANPGDAIAEGISP